MNEELEMMQIFEKNENGRLTVSKATVARLNEISFIIDELNDEELYLRRSILEGMIENNIDKCSQEGMTFTQVMPKPKATFDVDSFLLNESEDVVKCFTTFEEQEEFDFEKFKEENPEVYKKYTKKNIIPDVDTKKLQKTLQPVFNKYYHEEPSDKPSTLRITFKKGE